MVRSGKRQGIKQMADMIDMSNGRANMAFVGSRDDIWHKLGNEIKADVTADELKTASGLTWLAKKVPLWANIASLGLTDMAGAVRGKQVNGRSALVRSDTGQVLGIVAEGDKYQEVQPSEVIDFFYRYVGVDSRFSVDTAGALKGGEIIWAMASFADELTVAGDKHKARLLLTTSFNGTQSTIAKATTVRVVCWNTLSAAIAKGGEKSEVRIRHSTRFDAARVARELSQVVEGYAAYKAMGDAMVQVEMSKTELSNYFKALLDIPFNAKSDEISTRKMNQFDSLKGAYGRTLQEGTKPGTQWAALNAVTRYVDHDKSTRGGADANEARVLSAEFGSGAAMKQKAVQLLIGANGETIEQEIDAPPSGDLTGGRGNLDATLSAMGF